MHLEELQMENEYQLRLKDMSYKEKMKELSDTLTQEVESLKTTQKVQHSDKSAFIPLNVWDVA